MHGTNIKIDLGVISNCMNLGTVSIREHIAAYYKETNLK
jgi:hypothetical protein